MERSGRYRQGVYPASLRRLNTLAVRVQVLHFLGPSLILEHLGAANRAVFFIWACLLSHMVEVVFNGNGMKNHSHGQGP